MRPGYKQTEVGVIPKDWSEFRLKELATRITDGDHATPQRESSGYYLLSARNILDGRVDVTDVDYVGEVEYQRMKLRCGPEAGDVLISCSGTIGRVAVVPSNFECVLVRSAALVKIRKNLLESKFLQFWLQGANAQWQISSRVNQGAQPNLFLGHIEEIRSPVPPLLEQTAIAHALSDIDALLSTLDALIAKKRDIKQGAMQQLLTGKTRLPGFGGEWAVKRLDQLASIRSGGTPGTTVAGFWDGDIPWCTPTDITRLNGGKYLFDTSRQITSDGLSNSSAELIPANSVVMTSRATIGVCAINVNLVTTSQGFKNFVPLENTNVDFLYYLLQSQKQGFIQLCAGSTFLEIGKTQLAAYKVHVPPTRAEQTAIAEVLSDMDAELAVLDARREKTRLLMQGMMQELLTGKTRLV